MSKTYTIHEFLELQRKRETQEIERKLADPKIFKTAVITLALMLRATTAFAAGDPVGTITPIIKTIMTVLQYIGTTTCAFMWLKEVISAASSGDGIKELVGITVKYVMLAVALILIPDFILGIPGMMGK